MANVRCPMCSKFNPPEAAACAYCGARLKPVRPSSSGQAAPDLPAGDDPEWLMGLRSEGLDEGPADQQDPAKKTTDGDVPDWLSRIRERSAEEAEIPLAPPDQDQESEDTPDWMSKISPFQATQAEELVLPDWKSDLPSTGSSSAEDNLSWLGGLNLDAESPEPPSSDKPTLEFPAQSFGLTDFLREQGELASRQSPETPDFDDQSASSAFGTGDQLDLNNPKFLSEQGEQADETNLERPAWSDFSSFQADSQLPDWSDESSIPAQSTSADSGLSTDDFSSWLKDRQPLAEESSPAASNADEEPDDLAWLRSETADTQPPQPPQSDSGVPTWITDEYSSLETPNEDASDEGGEKAELGLPGWLTGSDPSVSQPDAPAVQPGGKSADMPDWLSNLGAQQPTSAADAEEEAPADFSGSASNLGQLPNWFTDFSSAQTGPDDDLPMQDTPDSADDGITEPPAGEDGPKEPFIDEETPDWLREFSAGDAAESETASPLIGLDEPLVPLEETDSIEAFAIDLPDWLAEESQPALADDAELAQEKSGEQLEKAQLPEWVMEMRPIEAAIPTDSLSPEADQRVEKAGPLAGLRGVLPTDELAAHYRKPPVYSVKLRVTEKQRGQASLLESIISQESQPLLIPPVRTHSTRIIPRILVALLLITALIVPRLLNLEPLGIPVLYPTEMLDMFEQIDQTQQESAVVLLAMDFEPGRAGEMQLTASAVIHHLMARGVNLVAVSTVPNGPALAQRLLVSSADSYQQQTQQAYDLNEKTVNLGYLPGGAISLLEFAQFPRRSAPADLSGNYSVWNDTFLQEINNLGDFAQIIVLTDSAETGRAWVEQVQPIMGDVPLFMVTSAQASPLLAPYLESRQISGLVSGVLGGSMYARLVNQGSGPPEMYLATYQVGLLLAFGLILVGGVVSGGTAIFKRNEKDEA